MTRETFIKELMKMDRKELTDFIKENGKQPKIVKMAAYQKEFKRAFGYIK